MALLRVSEPEDEDTHGENGDKQSKNQFSAVLVKDNTWHGQQHRQQGQNGPQRTQYLILLCFRLIIGRWIRYHRHHLPDNYCETA